MKARDRKRPDLICFDLDGTLYQDNKIYPRIIRYFFQDTPYQEWIPDIQARMERILWGKEPFRCGQFVPKQAAQDPQSVDDLFAVPTVTALLEPDPTPYFDRTRYTYVSDGWTLAMYLARRIGWAGDAFWNRFRGAHTFTFQLSKPLADLIHSCLRTCFCLSCILYPRLIEDLSGISQQLLITRTFSKCSRQGCFSFDLLSIGFINGPDLDLLHQLLP